MGCRFEPYLWSQFPNEIGDSAVHPKETQKVSGHLEDESEQTVNFPKRLRYKGKGKVLATIYKRPHCYQLYWRQRDAHSKLKSWFKDFTTYSAAKKHGDTVVADLAKGKQTPLIHSYHKTRSQWRILSPGSAKTPQ
jgi:hypothetical protein